MVLPGGEKTLTAYKIPVSTIAKWPPPNTINPSREPWFTAYVSILLATSTVVVATRIWTRMRKEAGGFGVDDALIIIAWAFAAVMTGISIYGVEVIKMDMHVWDSPKSKAALGGLLAWILEQLFLISLSLTKISVLLFFRRLIDRSCSPYITFAVWAAIAFTIAYYFAFALFLVFACNPVEASWKSLDLKWNARVKYKCVDRKVVDPLVGVLSVFSDLYSMAIPIYIVSKLKTNRRKKMVLYGVFCCGLVVVGAGSARTYYLAKLNTDPMRDLTRIGLWGIVWGDLELQLAIVCASAPAMKGFLSAVHDKVVTVYGSRKFSARSRMTGESNPTGMSGGSDIEKVYAGNSAWEQELSISQTRTTSEESSKTDSRKKSLVGGIMITETFSVDSNRHSWYLEERRKLRIP